jgi:uncharacterized protein (DUF952 family)
MQAQGETQGAPIDLADGYVHFSTAEQAVETATKHFTDATGLWLIAAETDRMGTLKWEVSRGNAEFPHLYETFKTDHVVWAKELPLGDNGHIFPEMS